MSCSSSHLRPLITRACAALFALAALVVPAHSLAVDPGDAVGGAGSAWFEGDITSQAGTNCSILGSPYAEIMVQASGSYGGLNRVPVVGDPYWVAVLVSVPGNPCGTGVSLVQTDVVLPPGTVYDSGRPIRCFGQPRSASTFGELTGGTWEFLGSTGEWCPSSASYSSVASGGLAFGYRPLASGQMFQLFVPVRSTQALSGLSGNHAFYWYTTATGVYANPAANRTWATVFASGSAGTPQFISSKTSVLPFWKASEATEAARSKIETWVNVYTAGIPGTLACKAEASGVPTKECPFFTLTNQYSLWQVVPGTTDTGPTGGWVPFSFEKVFWGKQMEFVWSFTEDGKLLPTAQIRIPFTVLSGPDRDGDGIADSVDACPDAKGTLANGCLPALQEDPDLDGIYGANDLCPNVDGKGAFNGCPRSVVTSATPAAAQQNAAPPGPVSGPASASLRQPIRLRVRARAKGVITAMGTIPRALAKTLGISAVVARGRLVVRRPGTVTVLLTPSAAARRAAAKLKGTRLTVAVKVPGLPGTSSIVIALR